MRSGEARSSLTPKELASLDLMITAAQQRGVGLDSIASDDDEAEAHADRAEAMWEARHGGIEFSDRDREVLAQIRDLAGSLETRVTLGQLIELRAEAVRNLSE
ncbi:MAG: hypothetical protein ABWY23_03755 [Mycetocola sp.]